MKGLDASGEVSRPIFRSWAINSHVKLRPKVLKECQEAEEREYGKTARLDPVFDGWSVQRSMRSWTTGGEDEHRHGYPICLYSGHRGLHVQELQRSPEVDGEVGNKKNYDPRSYLIIAEVALAERVKEGVQELRGTGPALIRLSPWIYKYDDE